MTAMQMLGSLFIHPRRAFTELEAKPQFSTPMILLLVTSIGVIVWFYFSIDVDAFINHTLIARGMSAPQRAQAAAFMTRNTLMGSAVIFGIIGLFIVRTIEAFYYFFVYEMLDVSRSFKQWFAFSWWTSLPQVIASVAVAIAILLSHGTPADIPAPLSLNSLVYHLQPTDTGYALLNNITLAQVLTLVLTIVGAQTWSKRSWALNSAVVLLPRVVLYGVWTWWSFFR